MVGACWGSQHGVCVVVLAEFVHWITKVVVQRPDNDTITIFERHVGILLSEPRAICSAGGPLAPCPYERLLRRPQEEDRPSPPTGHDQERSRSLLRGEPILRQALRQARRGGPPARPEEASWFQPEDGPEPQEAFGSGHGRTPRGYPLRAVRVPRKGGWSLAQRVHRESDAQAPRVEPKKRSLGAGERDEFLRAAWRMLVAGKVDAERLVFVDEIGANVSLSPLYAWFRRGARAFGSTPCNWGKNVTLLASITAEGLGGPCLALEGATTREVF